jgi:hypothetical protein
VIWYLPRFGNLFIQSAAKCTCTNFILQKSETFLCQSLGNLNKSSGFKKENHSQLSLKCSRLHELWSLKEMTGQIVSVVWHYCQRFSLRCWGKVFQWLPKDWHKKVSDFCKMKFVHVHFAADWMNKFPK